MRPKRARLQSDLTVVLGASSTGPIRNGITNDVWVRETTTTGKTLLAFWPLAETNNDALMPLAGSQLLATWMGSANGPNKLQILGTLIEATVAA